MLETLGLNDVQLPLLVVELALLMVTLILIAAARKEFRPGDELV